MILNPVRPQFAFRAACEAAGIDVPTLKNWVLRKPPAVFLKQEDRAEIGRSERIALSFVRVMQIALTAELVRLNVPPRKAAMVAAGFTDVGDMVAYWEGEEPKDVRLPGQLYPTGLTILLSFPDDQIGRVKNLPAEASIQEIMLLRGAYGASSSSAVVVNVNAVDARVRASLGLDLNWGRPRKNGVTSK